MTDQTPMDPFEARLAERVRTYADLATLRRIDALAMSRAAMSSPQAAGWLQRRLGGGLLDRGLVGIRSAAALAAVVVIGLLGIAVLGRPSDTVGPQPTPSPAPSTTGPVPEVLRHSWQRPYAVTPGLDEWGSGFLSLAGDLADFGPESGAGASRSPIGSAGLDTLVATATAETQGCAIGDIGSYRWSLEGKGTVMTLTPIGVDACTAREAALAGPWVRADLPPPDSGITLAPGTYFTSAFDPFGAPGVAEQMSYTVPDGWKVKVDQPEAFVVHHLPDASPGKSANDVFVSLFGRPRLAADFVDGAICGPVFAAPDVGREVDEIVGAIVARPGIVSTPPAAVTISGFGGQMLDVHLAPSWTGGCVAPDGPVVAMPILVGEAGPVAAVSRDNPLRLFLLDIGGERTLAIVIFSLEPTQPSQFEDRVAQAMPVIESFEFHPPTP
jgi:hypothetical protein